MVHKLKNIKANDTLKFTLAGILLLGGGWFVGRQIKKALEEKKSENAANQVDSNDPKRAEATVLAQRAHAAMFSTGATWLPDGTNEKELYRVATQLFQRGITFTFFQDTYKNLYRGRNFTNDLQSELDSSELTQFYDHLFGRKTLMGIAPVQLQTKRLYY